MVPIAGIMAGAVDYGRAIRAQAHLQTGLDAAVLAAARLGPNEEWKERGADVFKANAPKAYSSAVPAFQRYDDGRVVGRVDIIFQTELVQILGIDSINVGVGATARTKQMYADSCILALDQGGDLDDEGLLFNGAPNIDLNKCSLRSNTSLRCNGHDSNTVASIAAGSASGCSNPTSKANVVPDVLAPMAAKIETKCGGLTPGATWEPGKPPAAMITVQKDTHTQYHVCGDLTLSGSGYLTGSGPSKDSVIVVENGSLIVDDKSSISTLRTAFILTGNNTKASSVVFPTGNGKASTLTVSPPTSADNPWRGISLYQDPALTKGVDNDWGPGATFNIDGVVYLPQSDVLMRGIAGSGLSGCTKMVVNTLRTNGAVDIAFRQDDAVCAHLGVNKWADEDKAPYLSM
jgi:hypothetical protein